MTTGDELANIRHKKIMDRFEIRQEYMGVQLKREAGFGKNGEKNFAGIITELQMQTHLVIKDFRRKVNKRGGEYGIPVCIYSKPEDIWGYDMVTSGYCEEPAVSRDRIFEQVCRLYPGAAGGQIARLLN